MTVPHDPPTLYERMGKSMYNLLILGMVLALIGEMLTIISWIYGFFEYFPFTVVLFIVGIVLMSIAVFYNPE